jgi:hypothetical protein
VCFGHGFDYDINFEDADFIIKFVNDQHKSLFLLRWGEINATSTLWDEVTDF